MENAVHMNGMEDFIDNPRRVGDRVKSCSLRDSGGGQGKEFQVKEFERQCQTNNLVHMLSKEVLMANMSRFMEYVTVFAQN